MCLSSDLKHQSILAISYVLTTREICVGIFNAAKSGRTLPRLTCLLPIQFIAHILLTRCSKSVGNRLCRASLHFLLTNIALNAVGYIFLILLYRHSVTVIFNRKIPKLNPLHCRQLHPHPQVKSFIAHLQMLRPLEILFRFLTASLRVLPDVIILGDVRCGTTNFCGHLASLSGIVVAKKKIKCYTPFCPWAHHELDHKESFYFVCHYLGIVDPYYYRMAFPLKLTRWWEEKVLGNVFFTFDGCAQYLRSPSTPYLIANAYHQYNNNRGPPVLVACVRNPMEQAMSWWEYENTAMSWGASMGLDEWNTDLRSHAYPPRSIQQALAYSQSKVVQRAYADAEKLVDDFIEPNDSLLRQKVRKNEFEGQNYSFYSILHLGLSKITMRNIKILPPWAITWPGGQLSIIGNGYSSDIKRYNKVFRYVFGKCTEKDENSRRTHEIRIGYIHLVPLECQKNRFLLKSSLQPILAEIVHHSAHGRKQICSTVMACMGYALNSMCMSSNTSNWRNANKSESNQFKPSSLDYEILKCHFEKEIEEMYQMSGHKVDWRVMGSRNN